MERIITVYRRLTNGYANPVAEIHWTGEFHKDHVRFAKRHGGDFIDIQNLDEHQELVEQTYYA